MQITVFALESGDARKEIDHAILNALLKGEQFSKALPRVEICVRFLYAANAW